MRSLRKCAHQQIIIYTCVTVILFLSAFTRVPVSAESICPNGVTDSFRKKCYSLHTEWPDFWRNYNEAFDFCKTSGGILLSYKTTEEEEDFLRELYTKIHRWPYWVGGYRYNDWKYLSDNTSIPERLIQKNPEPQNCLAIRLSQNKLVPESCENNSYYICVYSGDECEQGLCYQISYTKETFNGAIKKCKQVGPEGKLLEIRNEQELTFYKHVIRKFRTFTFLTTKEQDELTFPWIWKQKALSFFYAPCEIYTFKNMKHEKYNCDENFGFVCEYQAKTSITYPSTAISNFTNSVLNAPFLPKLETTTKFSYEQPITSHQYTSTSSESLMKPTTSDTNSTASSQDAKMRNYNLPMRISKKTTKLIGISIAVGVLILIGIVILIILLVKIIKKNGKGNKEAVYLEPIVHNKESTIPIRHSMLRELPDLPHNSNSCIRTSNVPECESLQKPEFQEPMQDIYIYID